MTEIWVNVAVCKFQMEVAEGVNPSQFATVNSS